MEKMEFPAKKMDNLIFIFDIFSAYFIFAQI